MDRKFYRTLYFLFGTVAICGVLHFNINPDRIPVLFSLMFFFVGWWFMYCAAFMED